uniref:Reelin domain-containing protein n=3 Tax=Loa loa TaxID=7209 RepID=A0A1I7VUJ1_LOALO
MFTIRLLSLYGMLQQVDFTESDPACNLMIPIQNQNIISPMKQTIFKIRIFDSNDRETFEYDAENKKILQVRVEGGPFERAQIQARSIINPTAQVGRFVTPIPNYFKLVNCSGNYGSAIINDGTVSRRHSSLRWQPPNIPSGAIIFLASVIHSKHLYHIRSSFLSPVSNSTRLTKQGCGTSYGCFKIGNQQCLFGESCHFSLKWRCYKKSMIVEATHYGHVASFGLTESEKRAVLCISTNNNSSMNDYYITGDQGFPNVFHRPHSKRLKTINDGVRTFCRFEMERPRRNTSILLFGKVNSYGHPYKLRKWRIPGSNMCNPSSISSGVTRLPSTVHISSSNVHPSANACSYMFHILFVILLCFNYL